MNKIKCTAEEKNISIPELIKITKLSKSFVYDVINGKSSPTVTNARRIAKALNSTIDNLFPEEQTN